MARKNNNTSKKETSSSATTNEVEEYEQSGLSLSHLEDEIIKNALNYKDEDIEKMVSNLSIMEDNISDTKEFLTKLVRNMVEKELIAIMDLSKNAKKQKKVKMPPTGPKKVNGYIVFGSEIRPKIKEEYPDMKPVDVTKEIARRWKELDEESKEKYKH